MLQRCSRSCYRQSTTVLSIVKRVHEFPLHRTFAGSTGHGSQGHVQTIASAFDDDCSLAELNLVVGNSHVCPAQLDYFLLRARRIFCADNGASVLHHCIQTGRDIDPAKITVVGDFDSVGQQVLDSLHALGATVKHVEDQNRNDLEKTLDELLQVNCSKTVALGVMGKSVYSRNLRKGIN